MSNAEADLNPYAPPNADEPSPESDEPSEFEAERRSVLVCIALAIMTLGLYPAFWLYRRRPFLDGLDTTQKIGPLLPELTIGVIVLSIAMSLIGVPREVKRVGGIATTVCALMGNFRVANMLRSAFARTGRRLTVSSVATFFFGILYLQHKINVAADTRARLPPRKRRKKKRSMQAADATEGPEPEAE